MYRAIRALGAMTDKKAWANCWLISGDVVGRGHNKLGERPCHIEKFGEKFFINPGQPKHRGDCLDIPFDTLEEALQYFALAKAAEGT